MAKTYFAEIHIDVDASNPHPPNTKYRVSRGQELWDRGLTPVVKVQMVYDGVVSGRRSPSYPVGTDDYERVINAIRNLERRISKK